MTYLEILTVFVVLLLIGTVIFLMACSAPVKKSRAKKASGKKVAAKTKAKAKPKKKTTKKRK